MASTLYPIFRIIGDSPRSFQAPYTVGFLVGYDREGIIKRQKSYQQYKDEFKARHDSIMAKYGAPPEAKPPSDKSLLPAASDRNYRCYAFIKKRRLEAWPPSDRTYE